MANPYSYGSGTATQFTTGEQRQVLELGSKVHMFNPDVTPIWTVLGRSSTVTTPVPIFEWMEDEWFIRPDTVLVVDDTNVLNASTAGDNDTGFIFRMARQAQVEGFEKGGVYTISGLVATHFLYEAGTTAADTYMCVGIGKECDTSSGAVGAATDLNDRDVRFIASDGTSPSFRYDLNATTVAGFAATTTGGTATFTYVGNAGQFATELSAGFSQGPGTLADNDTATIYRSRLGWKEGANIGEQTSKKVRRLKNCTQIFREPYSITGTQNAAKMYGGPEMARLQARKLNKLKMDIEYSIMTNGAIALDATSENPQRTFAGLGVGGTTGMIQSLNGENNTDLQMTETYSSSAAGGLDEFDGVVEKIFQDTIAGSMRKTVFCSNRWMKKLTSMTRSDSSTTLNAEMGQKATAGLRVTTYYAPVGELEFIVHPLLNHGLDDMAVALDFGNLAWRTMATRDIQLRTDVVKDGRDGQTDEWLVEAGLELRNEQTHAIMKLV